MPGKVYFVGAGPGDPKLITLRGKELLEQADVVVYAGSLVNPVVLEYAGKGADKYDSAQLTLEQIAGIITRAAREGRRVVRLASGDPSIYGAVEEMSDALKAAGIDFEVVPGVSSFSAAAAALQCELTVPDLVQTVILTRVEGRTKMPDREQLEDLAKHGCTLALFLSAALARRVQEKLLTAYPAETPVAVVYKASWPDQKIIRGELKDLADLMRKAKIAMTAMIIVGRCLTARGHKSRLYDKTFSHAHRKASIS
ncbi:MAG: precorrin-4 C(11)-methyltransferase [Elusimicrobia bacterium]|nr:precorrin-4 C(11)-methyltransferase [Elusimicrobiota bacterium]